MVGESSRSLDEQGSIPRSLEAQNLHTIRRGDSFVKNLSPSLSFSTHSLANLPEQQFQAPPITEDDTVEYFPCLDIAESIPCIDIADSEDEDSLTLPPEAHQDEALYRLNHKKSEMARLVHEIKTERISNTAKDPTRSENHKTELGRPNPPPADRSLEVSLSNLPIPVSNRIPVSLAHDGHKASLQLGRGRGSSRRDARTLTRLQGAPIWQN